MAKIIIFTAQSFASLRETPAGFSTKPAISYGIGLLFCAYSRDFRVAVDAEPLFAKERVPAIRKFYDRLWPGSPRIANLSTSQLTRVWTVCESLLKFAGTGWNGNSARLLASAAFWLRSGCVCLPGRTVFWCTWAILGHWFCIAAPELPQIEFRQGQARRS